MCLRPHCGQRVRTVYLAPDFADSRDDVMFFLERLVHSSTMAKTGRHGVFRENWRQRAVKQKLHMRTTRG